MDNKTHVLDPQQEIAQLKKLINTLTQRVSDLEMDKKTNVYGKPTPIFGPCNNEGVPLPYITPNGLMGDWLKVVAVDDNKEIK